MTGGFVGLAPSSPLRGADETSAKRYGHPHQVLTRDQIFQHVWGGEYGDRHTVTVHVGWLRDKIEAEAQNPEYIVTVWGVGYRFEGRRR